MSHTVIYDGNCNLCSNLVQLLEQLDRGQRFRYVAMQEQEKLDRYGITGTDCELGMILLDDEQPDRRWQGSDAAEEITRLLPFGSLFIQAYRGLGLKNIGDQVYGQVRDHRYAWFGKREVMYRSRYPSDCARCAGIKAPSIEGLGVFHPVFHPNVIQHSQNLIYSFQHWTGRSLLPELADTPEEQAQQLFDAPFVVVSHGIEADPIFNYGNQAALDLWEFSWDEFVQLSSRRSAEPIAQEERDQLLANANTQGYINDYRGIRISRSGKRFWIESVILWKVVTPTGEILGQAATFPHWRMIE
jgi:predicted DCC family thiol-disulfide oxidoreductase YuxK